MRDRGLVAGLGEEQPSLPAFPDGSARGSSPLRDRGARVVAVLALAATAVYLGWRAVATIDPSVWWLSLPMYLLELHAAVGLGLYAFSLWNLGAGPRARPARETPLRVAVLIPTWNEPPEVLAPTIAAAVAQGGGAARRAVRERRQARLLLAQPCHQAAISHGADLVSTDVSHEFDRQPRCRV